MCVKVGKNERLDVETESVITAQWCSGGSGDDGGLAGGVGKGVEGRGAFSCIYSILFGVHEFAVVIVLTYFFLLLLLRWCLGCAGRFVCVCIHIYMCI